MIEIKQQKLLVTVRVIKRQVSTTGDWMKTLVSCTKSHSDLREKTQPCHSLQWSQSFDAAGVPTQGVVAKQCSPVKKTDLAQLWFATDIHLSTKDAPVQFSWLISDFFKSLTC